MRKKRMKLEGPGEKEREGENTYYMFFKEDCEYFVDRQTQGKYNVR